MDKQITRHQCKECPWKIRSRHNDSLIATIFKWFKNGSRKTINHRCHMISSDIWNNSTPKNVCVGSLKQNIEMKKLLPLILLVWLSACQQETVKKPPRFKYKITSPTYTSAAQTNRYHIENGCIYFKDYDRDTTIICGGFGITLNE